jgi:2-haloacid dehalogenase
MKPIKPKYVTFDLYGTLIKFGMSDMTRKVFADRVDKSKMEQFVADFNAYRFDEVLGAWQPYSDVITNALKRTCAKWNVKVDMKEALTFYEAVPTFNPHPEVPEGLAKVAKVYPLVMLSNASDDQIYANVNKLGAPVHAVFTAQQAQAYKPRMQAFEFMIKKLGCKFEDLLHVSASIRYDIRTAHELGIKNKVYVNRGYEPLAPYYEYVEIKGIDELPGVVGL